MIHGIINIYKEPGYTSHDVVAKLRGILKQKKIGHTGTLDPAAEGVLPVCLGKGTKLCDMMTDKRKTYRAVMLLGTETDTQDTTGTVLRVRSTGELTEEQVREAVLGFIGHYEQIPPMYSALKVNGKKLYELARQGKEVERKARPVEIYSLEIEKMDLPRVTMSINCSKGTYIRTLCYDIGTVLGCGGCMEKLVRTKVDRFEITESLRLDEVEELTAAGRLDEKIVPVDQMFSSLPEFVSEGDELDRLLHNGNFFSRDFIPGTLVDEWMHKLQGDPEYAAEEVEDAENVETEESCGDAGDSGMAQELRIRVYDSGRRFVGIYSYAEEENKWKPKKIFLGGD
ncbi:tRNA pseudouridine(55) synthase TruB [[Clostridium] symbiosum]|uniref:tRNA pseudouridine(55) synthase TruB n=1 Tax=Clostridium symbiosum TaxID=1512 RepID=UPI001D08006E|nr:tRNA pseudouridine(55) synthase TruB [[Clostridium] symbiosum]MCB6609534.1 tRNA pseudouridine(55) synthase TruB [[Clostridium] symbiosum]MCB6931478.1 tRNA pseudouridine(55) synthase TruB [[Clostridium] symbiosum]